jgi:hypothetical protein
VFAKSGNRQDLLKLAPFDFKAEALFLGSCGTCNTFTDSKSAIHLKDFVTTNLKSITTEDLSWDVSPDLIKSAIFNMVKSMEILSCSSDWSECCRQFMEWATHYNVDNDTVMGPAAYTGPVRLYFARMLFCDIMMVLAGTGSAPAETQLEVQKLVKKRIKERFDEYADDIDRLKALLVWYRDKARRSVQLRIDASAKTTSDKNQRGDTKPPQVEKDRPLIGGRGGRDGRDYDRGRQQDRGRDFRRRSPSRSPRRRSRSRSRSRSIDKRYRRNRVNSPERKGDSDTRPCLFEVGYFVLSKGEGKRCTKGSSCEFVHRRNINEYIARYMGLKRFKEDMAYYNTSAFGTKIVEAVNALN